MTLSPMMKLSDGVEMPALGLGVFQSAPEETVSAVATAIGEGYRLIDTAAAYFNEEQVGEGLRQGGVGREEIFVTTKLWMSDYGYDSALHAFDRSMRKLGLDQLDLYLLHWPAPGVFERTAQSWRALERLLAEGRTRAIGVCNFAPADLDRLAERAEITPAVNQVELHPYFTQTTLREANAARGIVTQAWSPIGGVSRGWGEVGTGSDPLADPVITAIAERLGRTPAQVVLRWQLEIENGAIPKSVRPERIRENGAVFDFELDPEEVTAISALDRGLRGGPDPEQVGPDTFGLVVED